MRYPRRVTGSNVNDINGIGVLSSIVNFVENSAHRDCFQKFSVPKYIDKAMWFVNLKSVLTLISSAECIQLHIDE